MIEIQSGNTLSQKTNLQHVAFDIENYELIEKQFGTTLSKKTNLQNVSFDIGNYEFVEKQFGNILSQETNLQNVSFTVDNYQLIERQFGGKFSTAKYFSVITDSSNNIKTFDPIKKEWNTLSEKTNAKQIETKGMTKLDNLIQNTTKSIKPKTTSQLDFGKTFSEPINLKSFKTISSITII
jgi:hypothetical protein